jgi:two-component system response regulator BaeR
MTRVLIVEDEKKLADLLATYFQQAGYDTHCLFDGTEVVAWVNAQQPDMVLLDLMLPGKDGITLCREIRNHSLVPIMMITARVDEIDRLLGLEMGADDYVCKPFSPREVVARVKAILRRIERTQQPGQQPQCKLQMDDNRYSVSYRQQPFTFTHVEYRLLKLLASEPGRIFSREQLMNAMYDDHRIVSDRTIDSHIKKIRKKFTAQLPDIDFIYSVYGVGYKLEIE